MEMPNACVDYETRERRAASHTIRGEKVLLAADLAALYGVSTKALNQAVKRNSERFPADFMFQLTVQEWNALRSQTVTSKGLSSECGHKL